ncbi:hypothetical protein D9758_010829 [Tetrapyrgos nigripes]|uniref:DUF7729 domain-containing protein n=1 Tax=Tetrapyrgos nigripes TaxID=182062 RepID=A0A8H5GIN7_9AGAR|nr:hypothetical protein D9758_010829 [Tetrapyrgos nigripes]
MAIFHPPHVVRLSFVIKTIVRLIRRLLHATLNYTGGAHGSEIFYSSTPFSLLRLSFSLSLFLVFFTFVYGIGRVSSFSSFSFSFRYLGRVPVSSNSSSCYAETPSLLITLVLFLIAACTRWIRHPAASPSNQPVPTIPSPTSPPPLPTPFPQPWDQSSLPLNFSTQGCYNFFLYMTDSDSFRSCRSFGMLQSFSDSFVNAQMNVTLLNEVLWGTCNPPDGADTCTNGMRDWVDGIMASCGQEWEERNEIVVQTRVGSSLRIPSTPVFPSPTQTHTVTFPPSLKGLPPHPIYLYSLRRVEVRRWVVMQVGRGV